MGKLFKRNYNFQNSLEVNLLLNRRTIPKNIFFKMNRFQLLLSLAFMASIIFIGAQADSDSDSESGSDSNESGNKKHSKKYKYHSPSPPAGPQAYSQPNYHYNHPVYMPPQGPPPSYGGYYPAPMPYIYGYPPPPPQQQPQPVQQFYGAYPYPYSYPYPNGGQFSQPQNPQQNVAQGPQGSQGPQGFSGIPGGTSTINHSLKVNKEYKEDGHHYRPNVSTE